MTKEVRPRKGAVEGLLDVHFRLRVHVGRRFVEDQDSWIPRDGSGRGLYQLIAGPTLNPALPISGC